MKQLGLISLNSRHFLTQLARNAYLYSSMNNGYPISDKQAGTSKNLVSNLFILRRYLQSLCFSTSSEPHGAGQAAGHAVGEMMETQTGAPMHSLYLFHTFKLLCTCYMGSDKSNSDFCVCVLIPWPLQLPFPSPPQVFFHSSGALAVTGMSWSQNTDTFLLPL